MAQNPFSDPNYGAEPSAAARPKEKNPFSDPEYGKQPERTWGQAIKDTGAQLAEGANTTLGAVPDLVAPDSGASKFFRDNAEYWRDKQSEPLKQRIADTSQRIQEAGKDGVLSQVGTAVSEYWNDPAQAARLVATNLPSMVPGLAAGKVAQVATAARGASVAQQAAAATGVASAANAVMNAGGARGEAFDDLQKAHLAQGASPDQARESALSESLLPAAVGGVAGAVSGKIGLEKAVLGQAGAGSALRKAAGAAGAELAGEQIEEVAPQVATNYQVGRVDPSRGLTDDLGRTMVETAIGAGPGAAVAGGVEGMRTAEASRPGSSAVQQEPAAAAEPEWGTSPGAAAPRPASGTTEANGKVGGVLDPEFQTSPGAAPDNGPGLDYRREIDTAGLALADDTATPSQRMGIDPAAGPLSAGAALAVDTGVSDQMQQAAALAQAAEAAEKGGKAQKQEQPERAPQGADPETGEIPGPDAVANWSDAQLSASFRSAQGRDVRIKLAQELSRRKAARAAEQPTPAKGNTNGPQAQPAGSQPPAAAAQAPAFAAAGAPAQGALSNARTTTSDAGAQAKAAAGAQAAPESADQRAQRIDAAGQTWTRLPTVQRQVVAEQLKGLKPVLQKNLAGATWDNLNGDLKGKIADLIAPAQEAPAAPAPAAPVAMARGTTFPPLDAPAAPAAKAAPGVLNSRDRAEAGPAASDASPKMAAELSGPVPTNDAEAAPAPAVPARLAEQSASVAAPALPAAAETVPQRMQRVKAERPATPTAPAGTPESVPKRMARARAEKVAAAAAAAPAPARAAAQPAAQELSATTPAPQAPTAAAETVPQRMKRTKAEKAAAPTAAPAAAAEERQVAKPQAVPEKMKEAKAKRESKAVREAREVEERRAAYFAPGNVVRGYGGGFDRVVSYQPADADGRWSVTVREVQKDESGAWADKAGAVERTHGTEPSKVNYATGPAARMQTDAAPEPAPAAPAAPVDSAEPAAAEPAQTMLERHNAVERGITEGTLGLNEYKATFAAIMDNKTAVIAELNKLTKDDLLRSGGPHFAYRWKSEKKDAIVNAAFDTMLHTYAIGRQYGSSSFVMSAEGLRAHALAQDAALRELVSNTTAEDLAARAAEVKAARDEFRARREAAASALQDPKTLQDFRGFMRHWIDSGETSEAAFLRLTPEQRHTFDALEAESTREAREKAKADARKATVRSAGETTAGEIIATKHTKHGHDLFVIQLADRVSREDYETLNTSARRLGGSYSSYRANGAIPGFQFRTRESAEAFQQLVAGDTSAAQAVAQSRRDTFEDDKSQTTVERLRTMADAIDADADASLSAERKINTARRARMAGAAEESARNAKAYAGTMRNLANAIEAGKAPMLNAVRTKTQLSQLQQAIGAAKAKQLVAKYGSWAKAEEHKHDPVDAQTVDFAEFPRFSMFRSDLAGLARQLLDIEGGKRLGAALEKVADDVTEAYTDWAKSNLLQVSQFGRAGEMADFANKADAERAIKRSGLVGKAVVLAVKRGQNRVVLSPGEALQRGLWQGDGDKRINLAMEFVQELAKLGKRRGSKALTIPWQLESTLEKRQRLQRMGIQTPAEYRSALRELLTLRENPAAPDRIKELERSMVGRQNDGLDFFPTASAVTESAVDAADIQDGMDVLEPSAGMGHIADHIREQTGVEPDVVELSGKRRELLEAKGYNLVGSDFLEVLGKQYDRIVMNPPFSDGRDIQHVRHAFSLLKPGGRLVAIMSESAFFQSNKRAEAFREWLDTLGATNEKLPDGSFMDPSLPVNTGVSARMVVLDKPEGGTPAGEPVFRRDVDDDLGAGMAADLLRIMGKGDGFSVAAQRQAVDTVRATVNPIVAAWQNAPEVVVAYDLDDPAIPQRVRDADLRQRSGGAHGAPKGFYFGGKAYLMASRLTTPADAVRVLYHEVAGHHGLRGLFGKELDKILNQVATMRRADVDAKMEEYGMRGVVRISRIRAAEEVLAEMAEKNPQQSFVQRAVAAIRNFLRAHVPGFGSLRLRDADIIQAYILPARNWVERAAAERERGMGSAAMQYSLAQDEARSGFAAEVRASITAGLNNDERALRAQVPLGIETPAALEALGVVRKPVVTNRNLIAKMHFEHGVPRAELERLGELLSNPVMVFKSDTQPGRMVVVTSLVVRGNPVVVAVDPNGASNRAEVVYVPSAYPKDNADRTFTRWIRDGLLQFANKKESRQLATTARLQLPGVVQRAAGFRADYKTEADLPQTGDGPDVMFSRERIAALKESALDQITQTMSHPGKVSLWDKTIGTMRNLAERAPAFKPVFESAQRFIDDVSMLGNDAADMAPRLLPRVDSWRDLTKKPITAADNKAVARPLFEGTLMWARDIDGTPVLLDDLTAKYQNLPADQKAQLLLRGGRLDPKILTAWQGLPVGMYEANVNTSFNSRVLKAGVVWSQQELETMFGLDANQVSLYQEGRAAIDRSIDMTARADMLRSLGDEYAGMRDAVLAQETLDDAVELLTRTLMDDARDRPEWSERLMELNNSVVKAQERAQQLMDEGYAPLSRFGRYTVDVVDAAGDRQYFGMFETKADSNRMKAEMEKQFPGATVTQGTMSQDAFKLFAGVTPESLEMFGSMLGLDGKGDDPKDKAFQAYLQLAKNNHSALKRLIHRKGIAGYSEDVGRVLAGFVYSNARLGAGGLNAGTMESAINAIPKEQGELKDLAMGLRDYIANPQEEGQAVRGMLFAQYLGGSLASAFVNMTQPFAVTLPWLTQFGGMKRAGAQMARALKDMSRKGFQYEPDLAAAMQSAEEDGVVSPQEIHQLMAQARGTGSLRTGDGTKAGDARAAAANNWERVKVAWGQPFALAEQFNRRSTFIAAYRIAKEQGMAEPSNFARKAVLETQFLYSKANKMRFARGAVGGTLMTFKTYSVSYLELMHRMWTQGGPEGKRAVGWAVAMLLLMSGAGGLPFMEDAEDLIDGAGQLMGYNLSAKQWRKQALRDVVGKEVAEFLEQGLSGLPGAPVDVSGRLGMGNLLPGTGLFLSKQNRERDLLEVAGPAGDVVARGFTAVRKGLTGDVGGAALELSPTAVRNAVKGVDMAATGIYKDKKGYKVIDTTLAEAGAKFLGFQPKSVAEVQEANSFMQRTKSFYTQTSSEIKAQWADALYRKDDAALAEARERLANWNRNNPEQPIVVKMPDVWKRVREMDKDRTQRIADTAPKALRQQMREAAREAGQAPA